jgi:mono/diheme cytochrome c family protein
VRFFLLGALSVIAALLLAGSAVMKNTRGFSARDQPGAFERFIANQARSKAMPNDVRGRKNPVPDSPDVQAEARAHWADHCAGCHANDGSGNIEMGKHMYPQAPDMRQHETQDKTDGELFFIIQNGIRMTGMPAWGGGSGHDEEASWKLVRFIRHLPQLTVEEVQAMEQLNPKSPDELKEEEEERKFLNGESNEITQHEHHH